MKKLASLLFIFLLILLVDQVTKFYALQHFINNYKINDYLSFELAINRGISWSFFDSQSNYIFLTISVFIFFVLMAFAYYVFLCIKDNKNVLAETLIISGGISNLIDRVIHCGVIDFIVLSYNDWFWPSFNFADIFIVSGILIMLVYNFKE